MAAGASVAVVAGRGVLPSGWDPLTDIPNLLYFVQTDSAHNDGSGRCDALPNLASGGGAFAQATPASRLTLDTTTLPGHTLLAGAGSLAMTGAGALLAPLNGNTDHSMWRFLMLGATTDPGSSADQHQISDAGITDRIYQARAGSGATTGMSYVRVDSGTALFNVAFTRVTGSLLLYSSTYDSTTGFTSWYVNGALAGNAGPDVSKAPSALAQVILSCTATTRMGGAGSSASALTPSEHLELYNWYVASFS